MKLMLFDEKDEVPMIDILLGIRKECAKHRFCSPVCKYYNGNYGDSVCVVENIIGLAPIDWKAKE